MSSAQGVFVVDADILKYLPKNGFDWRDTALLDFSSLAFDRIAVTNNAKVEPNAGALRVASSSFVLQREGTNRLWRMAWPLLQAARADNARIEGSLQKLRDLRIERFLTDDPKTDLEPLGLAPAELELSLAVSHSIPHITRHRIADLYCRAHDGRPRWVDDRAPHRP